MEKKNKNSQVTNKTVKKKIKQTNTHQNKYIQCCFYFVFFTCWVFPVRRNPGLAPLLLHISLAAHSHPTSSGTQICIKPMTKHLGQLKILLGNYHFTSFSQTSSCQHLNQRRKTGSDEALSDSRSSPTSPGCSLQSTARGKKKNPQISHFRENPRATQMCNLYRKWSSQTPFPGSAPGQKSCRVFLTPMMGNME